MGGGGAQIAAQQDSSIKAVIALASWLDNPSITVNNNTSILFISGENDNIAPNNYHTDLFYTTHLKIQINYFMKSQEDFIAS